MCLYEWNLPVVSYQPDKFADQRHCDTGDLMLLIIEVTLRDHFLKGLYNFMVVSPFW